MKKLWGGRFSEEVDGRVIEFTGSFCFDVRLLPYDIKGSIAHARMLEKIGLLTAGELDRIIGSLEDIKKEFADNPPRDTREEDVHTFVENRLREKLGDLAGKLHTARSRNDQVALDMKLYLLDMTGRVLSSLGKLKKTLTDRAGENLDVVMPGFTHLQPAQPVLLAHHLMAYFEMFQRDSGRFADAANRASEMPLGAGALAGTSIPIDREMVARELGFRSVSKNSLDSVSERDFPLEFLAAASITMVHLSRLAEEMVLWASPVFGFIELPDRLATGSSMMPQKKNPDAAELTRGKTGRVFGHLMGLLTVMKGLPLAYQRDLQEDKEAVFDAADTLIGCLGAIELYVAGVRFRSDRMSEEARRDHTAATDLAEYLVFKGMPFRQAHEVIGKVVRDAISKGRNIDELTPRELRSHSDLFDEDVADILSPAGSVASKRSPGSTSPAMVADAVKKAREILEAEEGGR